MYNLRKLAHEKSWETRRAYDKATDVFFGKGTVMTEAYRLVRGDRVELAVFTGDARLMERARY